MSINCAEKAEERRGRSQLPKTIIGQWAVAGSHFGVGDGPDVKFENLSNVNTMSLKR